MAQTALRSGCLVLLAMLLVASCSVPSQRKYRYSCPDGYEFTIRYRGSNHPGDIALLEDAAGYTKLPRVPAASGARYSNGVTTYWSKGEEAMILRGGEVAHGGCSAGRGRTS